MPIFDPFTDSAAVQGSAMLTIGDGAISLPGGQSYADYIASLNPVFWPRFNETSGTTIISHGSIANANLTWTPGAGALGQTGQLGANEAYDFDGAASNAATANNANTLALVNLKTFTRCFLIKPDSAGEGNVGQLYNQGGSARFVRINGAITALRAFEPGATSGANTVTTTGLSTAGFQWVFETFDNAGDRKIRLYRGAAGAVTEYAYSTQDAMNGAFTDGVTGAFNIGNINSAAATFDGLYDEGPWFDRVLTADEMLNMTWLVGLT